MSGMTGLNLMVMLETRLDNVMFRLGFARTRAEATTDRRSQVCTGER